MDMTEYLKVYGLHDFVEQVIDHGTCQLCKRDREFHGIHGLAEYLKFYGRHDFQVPMFNDLPCHLCGESWDFHEINNIKDPSIIMMHLVVLKWMGVFVVLMWAAIFINGSAILLIIFYIDSIYLQILGVVLYLACLPQGLKYYEAAVDVVFDKLGKEQ